MYPIKKINHIFVIQSLPQGDAKTGEELYYDVIKREIDVLEAAAHNMNHAFFDAVNKFQFCEAINYIIANAKYFHGGVLVHIETHGSKEKDGLVLSDGLLLNWKTLVDLLRPINISTCNNLFVSLATCHGREMWRGLDPFAIEKSAYQAYISASREVYPEETATNYQALFKMLINGGDLIGAYLQHEKSISPFFYKDSATAFHDTVKMYREGLDNDPAYRERILDHPVLQEFLKNPDSGPIMDEIIKHAFNEVIRRHLATFNFDNCE